jgi:hypothetical protein
VGRDQSPGRDRGFGAQLLTRQDPAGQWAGGAFFPADFDFDGPEAAADEQPSTATTWSLNWLPGFGLDASALEGTAQRLADNSRWEYDNLPYSGGEVDCCINSFTLSNGLWLGADVDPIVEWSHRRTICAVSAARPVETGRPGTVPEARSWFRGRPRRERLPPVGAGRDADR